MKVQFLLTEYSTAFKRFVTYMTAKYKMPFRRRSLATMNINCSLRQSTYSVLTVRSEYCMEAVTGGAIQNAAKNLLDPLRTHTSDSVK